MVLLTHTQKKKKVNVQELRLSIYRMEKILYNEHIFPVDDHTVHQAKSSLGLTCRSWEVITLSMHFQFTVCSSRPH